MPGGDPNRVACEAAFGAGAGYCLRVIPGPFVVTDVHVSAGCPDDVFVRGGSVEKSRWTIAGPAGSLLSVHGARLSVRAGEALFVGVQATTGKLSADPRCAVTWGGFTPYEGR